MTVAGLRRLVQARRGAVEWHGDKLLGGAIADDGKTAPRVHVYPDSDVRVRPLLRPEHVYGLVRLRVQGPDPHDTLFRRRHEPSIRREGDREVLALLAAQHQGALFRQVPQENRSGLARGEPPPPRLECHREERVRLLLDERQRLGGARRPEVQEKEGPPRKSAVGRGGEEAAVRIEGHTLRARGAAERSLDPAGRRVPDPDLA